MTKYSKGEWTNARYDICEIECDGEVYCTVATKDVELIIDVLNENEQLKFELKECREHKLFSRRQLEGENEQLKQSNERIIKDIDLALGFIKHKGYSLQDIKDYEDAKKEYEEDLANYRKGDV